MNLEQEYLARCITPSDINEHLPTLRAYAATCQHVTECGVRSGNSTVALACGNPKYMVSYDINPAPPNLFDVMRADNIRWNFFQADTLAIDLEPTDLLFIDTLHIYGQLLRELIRHAWAVERFIILHDTVTFGDRGEDGKIPGLRAAVQDGLSERKWRVTRDEQNNNGLMVIERLSS